MLYVLVDLPDYLILKSVKLSDEVFGSPSSSVFGQSVSDGATSQMSVGFINVELRTKQIAWNTLDSFVTRITSRLKGTHYLGNILRMI